MSPVLKLSSIVVLVAMLAQLGQCQSATEVKQELEKGLAGMAPDYEESVQKFMKELDELVVKPDEYHEKAVQAYLEKNGGDVPVGTFIGSSCYEINLRLSKFESVYMSAQRAGVKLDESSNRWFETLEACVSLLNALNRGRSQ